MFNSTSKRQNEFDQEELDFQRLHQVEELARRSHVSQSLSVSSTCQRSRKGSPDNGKAAKAQAHERSLRRLEQKAREDYARMLDMTNEVSLHYSIASMVDRMPIQTQSDSDQIVDIHFHGGRIIRGGRDQRPQHLVPTAPAESRGRDSMSFGRGRKRLCPDPVYESVPVLKNRDHDSVNTNEPRRGEMILRQAYKVASKVTSEAM
jgi:hypothetical protein